MADYQDQIITRCAPRWAWQWMENVLQLGEHVDHFDHDERIEHRLAMRAMNMACEDPRLESVSRADAALNIMKDDE